jgi:hypothetical protein
VDTSQRVYKEDNTQMRIFQYLGSRRYEWGPLSSCEVLTYGPGVLPNGQVQSLTRKHGLADGEGRIRLLNHSPKMQIGRSRPAEARRC